MGARCRGQGAAPPATEDLDHDGRERVGRTRYLPRHDVAATKLRLRGTHQRLAPPRGLPPPGSENSDLSPVHEVDIEAPRRRRPLPPAFHPDSIGFGERLTITNRTCRRATSPPCALEPTFHDARPALRPGGRHDDRMQRHGVAPGRCDHRWLRLFALVVPDQLRNPVAGAGREPQRYGSSPKVSVTSCVSMYSRSSPSLPSAKRHTQQ